MLSLNKILLILLINFLFCSFVFSQNLKYNELSFHSIKSTGKIALQQDSTRNESTTKKISIGGIFLSAGFGLSIPLAQFNSTSNSKFGLLGRVEYSSTTIFPFVIGGEISYFSYSGADNYLTQNFLNTFQSKIFGAGLVIDFALSRFLKSYYTNPFVTLTLKSNSINRVISGNGTTLPNVPTHERKTSVGLGLGFTIFVVDLYLQYTYMKDLTSIGIFSKIKIPVIRF